MVSTPMLQALALWWMPQELLSRHPPKDEALRANPPSMQVFQRVESVAFLLQRTKQTDEAAANELAETLGDLPLPIPAELRVALNPGYQIINGRANLCAAPPDRYVRYVLQRIETTASPKLPAGRVCPSPTGCA